MADAEVTVVVAAGTAGPTIVLVAVEVTKVVVVATVLGVGEVPKVAVNGRGLFPKKSPSGSNSM